MQRSYDQIIHDAALEKQHIVLAVDRAGIVGDDGETHQGIYDVAFLSTIPGVTILSASSYHELRWMLKRAIYDYEGVDIEALKAKRDKQLFEVFRLEKKFLEDPV